MGLLRSKQWIGGRLFTEIGSSVMKQEDYQWADDAYNKSPLPRVKCHPSTQLKQWLKSKLPQINNGRILIFQK